MFGITDRILWIANGVFVGILLLTLGVKYYQVNSLKAEVAKQTLAATLYANAIEISNTSIAQLKKDSDTAKAQGLKALKEAQKQTIASNKRLNDLRDKADNAKTCDESVDIAKELL